MLQRYHAIHSIPILAIVSEMCVSTKIQPLAIAFSACDHPTMQAMAIDRASLETLRDLNADASFTLEISPDRPCACPR